MSIDGQVVSSGEMVCEGTYLFPININSHYYVKKLNPFLFFWPPVREVCTNYEVVMFQPHTGTSTDLGYIANFYIAMLLSKYGGLV